MSTSAVRGPVEQIIEAKLVTDFSPSHLEIHNESFMHSVPKNSETHFKVIVVSDKFENVPLIGRHRLINATLASELAKDVHALSITARTPAQWDKSSSISPSPTCTGGFGK